MNTLFRLLTIHLGISLTALAVYAQAPTLPTPEAKIPPRWFDRAKEFPEALEAQKQTGADIFLYFARTVPDEQKGLCRWFENKGLKTGPMSRLLKDYIKVQITLPSNKDDEALAQQYNIKNCPTVIILHPDGTKSYCKPFDWPGNEPKLKEPDELVELFVSQSSPKYREQETQK